MRDGGWRPGLGRFALWKLRGGQSETVIEGSFSESVVRCQSKNHSVTVSRFGGHAKPLAHTTLWDSTGNTVLGSCSSGRVPGLGCIGWNKPAIESADLLQALCCRRGAREGPLRRALQRHAPRVGVPGLGNRDQR